MNSRWMFFPAPAATGLTVATCTGWQPGSTIVRASLGWSAGADGANSQQLMLRSDSHGAFMKFDNGTSASSWLSSYSSYGLRVSDSNSNVYEWSGGTMAIFATRYVKFPLSDWSGTLPDSGTNASTVELFS